MLCPQALLVITADIVQTLACVLEVAFIGSPEVLGQSFDPTCLVLQKRFRMVLLYRRYANH